VIAPGAYRCGEQIHCAPSW